MEQIPKYAFIAKLRILKGQFCHIFLDFSCFFPFHCYLHYFLYLLRKNGENM